MKNEADYVVHSVVEQRVHMGHLKGLINLIERVCRNFLTVSAMVLIWFYTWYR